MNPTSSSPDHEVWEAALAWVQRQHDDTSFDDQARQALIDWLRQDPEHRRAYDKAARLWLLAGLVPPANDLDPPPDCKGPTDA
ncbi:FecR/PupR family sigma factor regulator [Bordetella genomosp. 13]|uniref:FecR/PupR family sigma factor regulator n=1 Tax=Bordetella genomosp. 13 TaxID=463040 RepID=UPI0011AB0951|nr:FecR/PupR family sigma factor regulator [Bordetella genomosp. 13]